ncbi:helix-turn-helix transcriptional regulator [Aerococcaceae bacterium WGS1372]
MEQVARYRNYLGLTQQELANILDISKQSYWNKENGRTPFTDNEKVIIKNLLLRDFPNISIDEIFFNQMVLQSTE